MSDAGSGSRFPFLKRNRNDDTPSDFSERMDLNSPVTGEINQIFTPSQPRHAAAPSDATSDFPAMPTSTEGMDENTEREYAMALAQGMSLPFVDLNEYQVDKEVISMVPDDLCRRNQLLPLSIVNGRITVAMANPKNFAAIDDVSASTGMPVIPMVAMPSQVKDAINRYLRANAELTELSHEIAATAKKEVDLESDSGEDASPVARFVSLLINQAIDDHCSDIHIEPQEDGVAALPTVWGEKIVMRILSTPSGNLKVEDLNFSQRNFDVFSKAYNRPYGLVLVTGPTGSGKSTTLYATLGDVARPEINIITVEDPVEFRMRGINQVQVNNKAGMTFAAALRSILRADPDVVLIGEIRDQETANIAIEASLTGHLVLSTLHTNDAPSAVTRLTEMGVEPFLLSSSLAAVMAQRLARRLCKKCKRQDTATEAELRTLGVPHMPDTPLPTIWRPVGCRECANTGYSGRVAIQQVMGVDSTMEDLIARGATSIDIDKAAKEQGMTTLRKDGWQKALQGITSVEEVLRVTV